MPKVVNSGGHLDISDEHAVEQAGRHREQKCNQHGDRYRDAGAGEMEHPSGRHRVDRDDRQIDAATDHEDRHPNPENAQDGDTAHECEKIAPQ